MNNWITSDSHINHTNIIKYCNRPFKNVAEMDEVLIENINSLVRPDDTLWHLGDFAFGRALTNANFAELCNSINCRNIHLIIGNHDKKIVKSKTLLCHFSSAQHCFTGFIEGRPIILTHTPPEGEVDSFIIGQTKAWKRRHKNSVHLYGHTHNNENYDRCNMCVEYTDYKPVRLKDIYGR